MEWRFGSSVLVGALLLGACAGYAAEDQVVTGEAPRVGRGAPATVEVSAHLAPAARAIGRGAGVMRAVVSRVSSLGERTWTRSCAGTGALGEPRVAVTGDGGVVLGLTFQGSVDCGDGPVIAAGGPGDLDALLVRFGAAGEVVWARSLSDLGPQAISAVAVDPWDGVVVAGSFEGTVDLGGPPMSAGGDRRGLVALLEADGALAWQRVLGEGAGAGPIAAVDVAVTPRGRIVVLARGEGAVDLGAGPLSVPRPSALVAAFEPGGRGLWSRALTSTGEVLPRALRAGPGERVTVSGTFTGAADFGDGWIETAGRAEPFVARVNGWGAGPEPATPPRDRPSRTPP